MSDIVRNRASDTMSRTSPEMNLETLKSSDLAAFAPNFVREDHRRIVGAPPADAEEYRAGMIAYFESFEREPTLLVERVIAVRGERLALVMLRISFEDGWDSDSLVVVQYDEAIERLERLLRFDPDDEDAASQALEEAWIAMRSE